MKEKKWRTRLACGALVLVTVTGVALAAGTQGSRNDPLVTLSYLNDVLIPDLMARADIHIEEKANQLMEEARTGNKAVFGTVEVSAGSTISLTAGTQVILRTGTASNVDGLIDLTNGASMWDALQENHLYIAAKDGQLVTVTENALFLIQGRYTIV
mgnify:CR=1 FL=1